MRAMAADVISTSHMDYLQRVGPRLEPPSAGTWTSVPFASRRLWHVRSVGVVDKGLQPAARGSRPRLPSEDLLTALHGAKIPAAFLLRGRPGGVAIHLGTWGP